MKRELSIALFNKNFDNFEFLKRYFKRVYLSKTLNDFCKILELQSVDIVLVDDIDVIKMVKKSYAIKIIAIADKTDIEKFLNLNLKYILLKPLNEQFYINFENYIVAINQDIKSHELNRKLSLAIKQSVNIVVITDSKGIIEYINPIFTKITGYTSEDVMGKNINILSSKKQSKEFYARLWKVLQSGKVWSGEFINRKKNGKLYYEKTHISPVFDSKYNIINYIAIKEDITKYKLLQLDLEEKEKLILAQSKQAIMGEIISIIAHHWRQPISVISTILNKIIIGISLGNISMDEIEEHINLANGNINELSGIIDNFKNYFRHSKELSIININNIINKSLHILKFNIEERGIEIQLDFLVDINILALESELTQVVLNILINAVEIFIQRDVKNPKISIKTYEKDNLLIVDIDDNGGGFDEEDKFHIFEPYFSKKNLLNSTGLGLYIASIIIRNHMGGDIIATNITNGAIFSIRLPIIENSNLN